MKPDSEILPFWKNWLRLLSNVNLCTSTYCSRQTASLLRVIIAKYLYEFQRLYPHASFIPKMHYLVHLPDQMLEYGPLRHLWCMRFEGKNGFFKVKKWRNFRNLPYSLAKYHQLHMLHRQTGSGCSTNENFLYAGDVVASGSEVKFDSLFPDLAIVAETVTGHNVENVYVTQSVCIHGCDYRIGCALVVKYEFDDTPVFAVIKHIYVEQDDKYFVIEETESELNDLTLLYTLKPNGVMKIISVVQ